LRYPSFMVTLGSRRGVYIFYPQYLQGHVFC
jgi:hypothetical protein